MSSGLGIVKLRVVTPGPSGTQKLRETLALFDLGSSCPVSPVGLMDQGRHGKVRPGIRANFGQCLLCARHCGMSHVFHLIMKSPCELGSIVTPISR
jgi:hypothetical protein